MTPVQEITAADLLSAAETMERSTFGWVAPPRERTLGITVGGVLVAFTRYVERPDAGWQDNNSVRQRADPEIAIQATVVLPNWRKRGLARKIRAELQARYGSILTAWNPTKSEECMHDWNIRTKFIVYHTYPNGSKACLWKAAAGGEE